MIPSYPCHMAASTDQACCSWNLEMVQNTSVEGEFIQYQKPRKLIVSYMFIRQPVVWCKYHISYYIRRQCMYSQYIKGIVNVESPFNGCGSFWTSHCGFGMFWDAGQFEPCMGWSSYSKQTGRLSLGMGGLVSMMHCKGWACHEGQPEVMDYFKKKSSIQSDATVDCATN